MLIDVDQFKEVNTRFGHLTGDVVLANTAALLKHSVRGSDAVFRYGGDEFLIILADTSCTDARHVVERIKTGLVGMEPRQASGKVRAEPEHRGRGMGGGKDPGRPARRRRPPDVCRQRRPQIEQGKAAGA